MSVASKGEKGGEDEIELTKPVNLPTSKPFRRSPDWLSWSSWLDHLLLPILQERRGRKSRNLKMKEEERFSFRFRRL